MGAGLDTFGFRHSHRGLQTFEVDHPATQAWKRGRLMDAGIDVPAAVTFVPVDFETDSLTRALEHNGFRSTEPAVFVWLGVVFYLTPDAALSTLEYVAGQPHPTEVVFDYLQPAHTDESREHLQARADRLAAAGEAWHTYFTPDDLARQLRVLGFTHIEDRSAAELVDSYSGELTRFVNDIPDQLRASRIVRAQL
ncbi:hypothetical protein GCM10007304_39610 [Rhodococcoides trifolii]|uniref:S-adenosyl-L-methionine-dependent methyltransferase n=1 Tax=Rhodococcoides trifolii TaxID=908250 RepID=A0A917G475_9NOCA|nr:hypothetical protein GCM10007304_39610 [Rhodococcus trifolii]